MNSHVCKPHSFVLATVLCLIPHLCLAADFTGKVVGITDGDTIKVMHSGREEKVRLQGIDCPERDQAFGQRAKQATSALAFGQEVTVMSDSQDRYGRTLGEVRLPDGKILNQELVRTGMCWWYRKYAPGDTALEGLEADARASKKGLWADSDPIPPWEWRKRR